MSYKPTNWKDGDLVTAKKLNKLEQGVANSGGVMIVHNTSSVAGETIFDKTWQEIFDALANGSIVILAVASSSLVNNVFISTALYDGGSEVYEVYAVGSDIMYSTNSPEGYPAYVQAPM